MPAIWAAVNNKDDDMWLKWFGEQPSTDADVQSRLAEAATWMES
jgi:hypothetical protein